MLNFVYEESDLLNEDDNDQNDRIQINQKKNYKILMKY